MHNPENDFPPMLIDQQIDHPAASLSRGDARLIQDLQALYKQEKNAMIDRVWSRLASQRAATSDQQETLPLPQQSRSLQENLLMEPINRTLAPKKRLPRLLGLVAAVLVSVALVGSMALVFTSLRNTNTSTGGQGSTPTTPAGKATTTPTATIPSACLDPMDLAEQSLCASHAETTLNVTKTFTTEGNGTWNVVFLRAYAGPSGLLLLYTVKNPPSPDWISFMSLTIQQGIVLQGSGEQGCGSPNSQQCQLVKFATSAVPAGTTELHVQAISDAFSTAPAPLQLTIPFTKDSQVTVPVHQTQTVHGMELTLDHIMLINTETLFYFTPLHSQTYRSIEVNIASITINGQKQTLQGTGNSISGPYSGVSLDMSFLDKPGSWTVRVQLGAEEQHGGTTNLGIWTFHFTVKN